MKRLAVLGSKAVEGLFDQGAAFVDDGLGCAGKALERRREFALFVRCNYL